MLVRWRGAADAQESAIIPRERLDTIHSFPATAGIDKPEAVTLWERRRALVLHDSPANARVDRAAGLYRADLIGLD